MPAILVLCNANQFRSPLAAAALRRRLDAGEWEISSAGVWAQDGLPAARGLAEWSGLPELAGHRSRAVDSTMLAAADLILVMERGQEEALRIEFPAAAERVHLLSAMSARAPYDLPDPALGRENPQRLAAEILGLVEKGLPCIRELALEHARLRRAGGSGAG
jgi:protein-tyrosine phosphatase